MNKFKNINIIGLAMALCLVISMPAHSNEFGISDQKLDEISTRVNSMSLEQLNARANELRSEKSSIEQSLQAGSDGSASSNSSAAQRLKEIVAEFRGNSYFHFSIMLSISF